MVPTLTTALALKGQRPMIGTADNKDRAYVFASVNVVSGQITSHQVPIEVKKFKRVGAAKFGLLQNAFAKHLRAVAHAYPCGKHPKVIIVIDNAPWHAGAPIRSVLDEYPHIELYRLPSYSPQLNPIERLWKAIRRRTIHNRCFTELKFLRTAITHSIQHYQAMKKKTLALMENPFPMPKSLLA